MVYNASIGESAMSIALSQNLSGRAVGKTGMEITKCDIPFY